MATNLVEIWIAKDALSTMRQLADDKFPLETGGMLVGYLSEANVPVVTSVIGPGPNARHGRYKFTPDGKYQQEILESIFQQTGYRETYLGDWHTHPRGSAALSYLDKCTLASIAHEPQSQISHPIMAVLGDGKTDWVLSAVRFDSTKKRLFFNKHNVVNLMPIYY